MIYALALGSAAAAGCSVYMAAAALAEAVSSALYRLKFEARLTPGTGGKPAEVAFRIFAQRILKIPGTDRLVKRMAEAGVRRPRETAVYSIMAALPVTGASILIVGWSPSAVVPTVVAGLALYVWLKKKAGDRLERFSGQLPSVFKATAAALKAGASIQQALVHTAEQMKDPAGEELAVVNEQISLGMPVDEALAGLYERMPAIELNFILMGLSIQRRIGGNLVKLLTDTTVAIEERRRLQRNLTVETAQARLSARVIGSLPIIVTALIALVDPSFIAPLFATFAGLVMLFVAIAAETAGFLLLGRILDVKI